MATTPEEHERKILQANENLTGWLDRLDKAKRSLQELADFDGQPPRFQGMTQWFTQVPEGTGLTVTPPDDYALEGGLYFGHMQAVDIMPSSPLYRKETPFTGGVAIRATLQEELMERKIVTELVCMNGGDGSIGNGPVMFSKHRPNGNYLADAVIIPDDLQPQVAIAIVDGAAQPMA
ncbi:MAG TPA: hypothetical protein VNG32_00580 [Candidatus Dormibacteraeota bacterium]|nr:hypothetical protein [Candidatus Dormibacteraeota bacterium]